MVFTALMMFFSWSASAQNQVIHLAVDNENPPYMYQEGLTVEGLYPLLLREIFHRMGVPLEVRAYPWKRALHLGKSGKAGVGGAYKTEERLNIFDYSAPIYTETLFLYVNSDNIVRFNSLEDLKGKKIGVLRGWSYGDEFDKAKQDGMFTAYPVNSDSTNFKKLLLGTVDGIIATKLSALLVIKKYGYQQQVKALEHPIAVNHTHIFFSKHLKHQELLKDFNETLMIMKEEGSYDQLVAGFLAEIK